jgi:hypothetical protein
MATLDMIASKPPSGKGSCRMASPDRSIRDRIALTGQPCRVVAGPAAQLQDGAYARLAEPDQKRRGPYAFPVQIIDRLPPLPEELIPESSTCMGHVGGHAMRDFVRVDGAVVPVRASTMGHRPGRRPRRTAALAGAGMDVVILGRRGEVLRRAAEEINRERAAGGGEVSRRAASGGGLSGEVSWVRGDVSDPGDTAAAVEVIRERYPVVDVVVNNAGGGQVISVDGGARPPG